MLYLCILISTRFVFDKKKLKKKVSYVLTKKIKIISKLCKVKVNSKFTKMKTETEFCCFVDLNATGHLCALELEPYIIK